MPIVNLTNKKECEKYNHFVKNAVYTSITQQTDWSQVKKNWQPLYVYLEKNQEIIAAMSILMIESISGKKFAYVTKGPVLNKIDLALIDELIALAEPELKKHNVFLLRMDPEFAYSEKLTTSLKARGFLVRNRECSGKETIQPRYNMLVDLKGKSEEEVLAERYGKTRYRIRYAQKKGLKVVQSQDMKDLEIFYQLYKTTSERHGISYRPESYFKRLAEAFLASGQMNIILVTIDDVPDAGGLCFISGKKVWYMYAGSTHKNQVLMAPYLVNWEGIKWALQNKCDYYDLGGVFKLDNSDGLYQFKYGIIRPNQPAEYIGEIDKVYDTEVYQAFLKN